MREVPTELKDPQVQCSIPDGSTYTKTLGIEWNTVLDQFRLAISAMPPKCTDAVTKHL